MFIAITPYFYQGCKGREHFWSTGDGVSSTHLLAGAMLSDEVVRIRLLRTTQLDTARYQLADGGGPGTLPYHSWIVAKGDEAWPSQDSEAEARTFLEPYLRGFSSSSTALRLTRPLASKERIYGLGERTGEMDKRGQAFPIWNIDPPMGHGTETLTMYASIPFYLSLAKGSGKASGLLVDFTGRIEMDMGHSSANEASMTVQGDNLTIYFFAGPNPADVLRQYTELTGRMPMPPRWSLGYHQCRWSYTSEQQVRQLATRLRERNHPCDAIWLDIDYMHGFRDFTWNPETFPDPAAMAHDLHAQGLHLVTILDPGIKVDENYSVYQQGVVYDYFCRSQDGTLFQGKVWPGACVFLDYSRSDVRAWWSSLAQGLLDQGVDGLWNDMNEPALFNAMSVGPITMDNTVQHRASGEQPTGPDGPPLLHEFFHNAYGMEMARSSYEGLRQCRPDSRPFTLTRSGTAGMQRYSALWTGDNTSTWEHILMAMPMCLNIGMSGVPFVGVDIGGFWEACNGELLTRFAQLGALLPLCRNHNAISNPDQEPWAFGEPYESAYRKAIETRYRLLPYLYTLFHEAATTGAPIMRPLYYHYPQNQLAQITQDEFLIGDSLLSAPIYEQGATSRKVYLPEGIWFDYWNGNAYLGSGWRKIDAPLERWPLLVRGNSILPTGPVIQYTDERPTDPLTFTCYMLTNDLMRRDSVASYTLYEDDGATQAYHNGAFARTTITCRVTENRVEVSIEEEHDRYRPQREAYEVIVHVGGHVLQQRVEAGQGKITLQQL